MRSRLFLLLAALALAGAADTEAQGYRPAAPATATYFDFCVQGGKPAKCATSHRMDLSAIPTGQCITRSPASAAGIAGAEAGLSILPATVNPYPAGSVERAEWEAARATCAAISRRWGRRTPFIGGPDVADGYFCPSNENLGQSVRALTEHFGRAPSELELLDFLHTCTTDQVGRAVASRFVSTGGGGGGGGCTVRHWTATPDWPLSECARWYPASTFTERGCCGQKLADGRHRCVEHPSCWPVEPPPPPPVTCPDGTCSDAERADGSCPADCPVEPPPPPPGKCSPPPELTSRLAEVEAALAALLRAWEQWLTTPGEPSTGQTTSTLRSEPTNR